MSSESTATKPIVNVERDGTIVIKIQSPASVTSTDELVHRGNCGLEPKAFDGLVHRGELRARKIGRKVYARRSDVLALVDAAPAVATSEPKDDLADAVARKARRSK